MITMKKWQAVGWLALVASSLSLCMAVYDEDLCKEYTKNYTDFNDTPFFYDDFSVRFEETFYKDGKDREERLGEGIMRLSGTNKQVEVTGLAGYQAAWFYVDVKSNKCFFQIGFQGKMEPCITTLRSCENITQMVDYVTLNKGKVSVGSAADALEWPGKKAKSIVDAGKSTIRSIAANKYIACTYDDKTKATVVTEWYFLDSSSYYSNLGKAKPVLLGTVQRSSKTKGKIDIIRTDYNDHFKLAADDIAGGQLHLSEDRCTGFVYGGKPTTKIPSPSLRHSFSTTVDKLDTNGQPTPSSRLYQNQLYNYDAQIYVVKNTAPKKNLNEKEVMSDYNDFKTAMRFSVSELSGECTPYFGERHLRRQQLPRDFWQLSGPVPYTFRGVQVIRGIPCNEFEMPQLRHTVFLYVATPQWLKSQRLPEKSFYPVLKHDVSKTTGTTFTSYWDFKDNPGYIIPELTKCYMQEDIVFAKMTIKQNYYKTVANKEASFDYQFRTMLRKITGIKATLRFAGIKPRPSGKPLGSETEVTFRILGRAKGYDKAVAGGFVDKDNVTSADALEKIKAQVAAGSFDFKLGSQKVKRTFRQNSFAVLDPNINNTGLGTGAMAGVGVAMLVVGVALAIGVVLAIKRYRQGLGVNPSMGVQKLHEDNM